MTQQPRESLAGMTTRFRVRWSPFTAKVPTSMFKGGHCRTIRLVLDRVVDTPLTEHGMLDQGLSAAEDQTHGARGGQTGLTV
jgi:hypothetical protein